MFYFKLMGTDARRVNNWEAQGPHIANYSCLAAAQWADEVKAGRSLCRVYFVGRAEVDTIMRREQQQQQLQQRVQYHTPP